MPIRKYRINPITGKLDRVTIPEELNKEYIEKEEFDADNNAIIDKAESIDDGEGNSASAPEIKDAVKKKHTQNTDIILMKDGSTELFNGGLLKSDLKTDRWLESDTNTFLGVGVVGSNNLEHTINSEGYNNVAIGHNSLYHNSKGFNNTAIGDYTLHSNIIGWSNIAIGVSSLYLNESGYENIAIGEVALEKNISGLYNLAMGHSTLRLNNGNGNVALGHHAILNNTIGQWNTVVGINALGNNIEGSYNVAIGAFAGFNETGSNKLYIENSDSNEPLIYGEFDNDYLKVNGKLETRDELKIKVYAQDTEPTLSENQYMAMWEDTSESGSPRVYLIYRRGAGDQVSVELA